MDYRKIKLEPADIGKQYMHSVHKITNSGVVIRKPLTSIDIRYRGDIIENEKIIKFKQLIDEETKIDQSALITGMRQFISCEGELNDTLYPIVKGLFSFNGERSSTKPNKNENNVGRKQKQIIPVDLYEISFSNLLPMALHVALNEHYDEELFWLPFSKDIKDNDDIIFDNFIYNQKDTYLDEVFLHMIEKSKVFRRFKSLIDTASVRMPGRYKIPQLYKGIKFISRFEKSRDIRISYNPEMEIRDRMDLMRLYTKGLLLPIYAGTMYDIVQKSNTGVTIRSMANMRFIFDVPKSFKTDRFVPLIDFERIDNYGEEIIMIPKINKLNE